MRTEFVSMSNSMPPVNPITIPITIDRVATGGAGISLAPDGRVMMVHGGLPGDVVRVEVTKEKKRFLEARVASVVQDGPLRRRVTCGHHLAGCGGCDWQAATVEGAIELRRQIVEDSLRRLGRIDSVKVVSDSQERKESGDTDWFLAVEGYRTTVRAAVADGKAGFRKTASNEIVTVDACETAHPMVQEVLRDGHFPGASEIVIKVGSRTGDRLVISDAAEDMYQKMGLPAGTASTSRERLRAGENAWIHEEVAGRRFRISADSFFQCRPDGAEALIRLVGRAIEGASGSMVDAYSGVGLFGAILGEGRKLTSVESNRSSVADAQQNLPKSASIVRSTVETWAPVKADVVIADPARRGLAAKGAAAVAATGASVIALISCDPASLARDARLLVDDGFELDWVRTVDLFGQTSHVETVARFSR